MKLQENVYKVTYKNGYVREWKAYSMSLEDGKLYECIKAYPFDNGIPHVHGCHCLFVEDIDIMKIILPGNIRGINAPHFHGKIIRQKPAQIISEIAAAEKYDPHCAASFL